MTVETSLASPGSPRGLVIYGDVAVGKSTLDLNLRKYYFGEALTQDDFQTDSVRCFLGKTAKRGHALMSTGGAEALIHPPDTLPLASWYVAALPPRGRAGVTYTLRILKSLGEVYAVCLYTDRRREYLERRVQFFSGRESKSKLRGARQIYPDFVPMGRCASFRTECMHSAFTWCVDLLGRVGPTPSEILLLEDFVT